MSTKLKVGDTAEMTPSDVLRAAADQIVTFGWLQGFLGLVDEDAPVCAVGAVVSGSGGVFGVVEGAPILDIRQHVMDAVEAAAKRRSGLGIVDWNNAPGRTADEVIALLLTVADELETP